MSIEDRKTIIDKDSEIKLNEGETILFKDYIYKINHAHKKQRRILMITNKKFYNILPTESNLVEQIQGSIELQNVLGITVSKFGKEFIIHVNSQINHDYRFEAIENREKILFKICKAYNNNLNQKLKFYYKDDLVLGEFCTTKKDLSKKNIKIPKQEPQYMSPEDLDKSNDYQTETIYNISDKKMTIKDFNLVKVLGRGAYGKVMLAQKKDDLRLFAIKSIRKEDIIQTGQLGPTKTERYLLEKADCPFLVNMDYAFQSETKIFYVMKFFRGGELYNRIKAEKRFNNKRAKFYFAQIFLAIQYLHQQNIVYRDLKPENILMDEDGYLKLTDYGLAKNLKQSQKTYSFVGTPDYLSPEIVNQSGHDFMVDYWCLGILLFEMLVGIPPFFNTDQKQMFMNILNKELKFPNEKVIQIDSNAKDLISELLQRNPQERIGFNSSQDVKNHPYFKDFNWQDLIERKMTPDYIPQVSKDPTDVSKYFDDVFTKEKPQNTFIEMNIDVEQQFTDFTYLGREI